MTTLNRITIVRQLLAHKRDLDLDAIAKELKQFPWDYTGDDMARLTRDQIVAVLRRYQDGKIDATKVEQWGDLIEGREDIVGEEAVREVIFVLANPLLHGAMTKEHAERIIISLAPKKISLAEAKAIAEKQAFIHLKHFGAKEFHALEDAPLEAEHCWMFFQNKNLNVPLAANLGIKWAHVVSKRGTYSYVQDFSDDPKRLQEYLQTMSDYFERRAE